MHIPHFRLHAAFLILIIIPFITFSQEKKSAGNRHFYFSWGYNKEWYNNTNLHIVQPGLNNNYTFYALTAHDHIGWDNLLHRPITIPQYNYRLGYFFDRKQNWGIELNFDHTKYVVTDEQLVRVAGIMNSVPIDMIMVTTNTVLRYQLNNGANFFLINIVRRHNIYSSSSGKIQLDFLAKAGIGPVVPHVQNTIFGQDNIPHFQLGGWNAGIETTVKATFFNHVYLEFCNKYDYARYSKLKIYEGIANHSFFAYELILNLGYTFSIGKRENTSDKK